MKRGWSSNWISSRQPRKQRKYRYNAPLHIKSTFLNVHLSPSLREKYKIKSIRIRKGDIVKIMRGSFKGKEEKVSKVLTKKEKVYIEGIEKTKKDGTKVKVPVHPSNLMIIDLNLEDKKRKVGVENAS